MNNGLKRSFTILINAAAIFVFIGCLSFLYQKAVPGTGLSWIEQTDFEESDKFSEMVNSDLENIRRYEVLREAFQEYDDEEEGPNILIVDSDNGRVTYSLNDIKAIASSNGCNVNEETGTVTMTKADEGVSNYEVKIISKSYDPFYFDNIAPGPAQGLTSIRALSIDAVQAYAEYIRLKNTYDQSGSNFVFTTYYQNSEDEISAFRNSEKTFSDIEKMNKYVLVSRNNKVDSNINPTPMAFLQTKNTFDFGYDDDYILAAGIDTDYPFDDRYKAAHDDYRAGITRIYSVMSGLAASLLVAIITFILIIRGFGNADPKKETFTDKMPLELLFVTTGLLSMIAYVLLRLTLLKGLAAISTESMYLFWKSSMKAVCIYLAAVILFSSIYRRSVNGGLYKNSILNIISKKAGDSDEVGKVAKATFGEYMGYMVFNILCISAIIFCYFRRTAVYYFIAYVVLAIVLVSIDVYVLVLIYKQRRQRVLLREALSKISSGETGLAVDETLYSGGELRMAKTINNISLGLTKALTEQVKAERLKADLITNVSHDIRTPLTSIINYVDLIKREDPQDEKIKEYVAVLEKKSARLKNLTEDLLEASKASSGNIKLDMQKLDLVELAIQAGGEFDDKMKARGLELELSTPDSPVYVMADGRHLWRVFENLYNNAAKYALENTRVYADVRRKEDNCIFTVKNISKEKLNISPDELTERFVRGDVSRTTEGSGLGLSIAQSLTKLMGGQLVIEIDGDLYKANVVLKALSDTEELNDEADNNSAAGYNNEQNPSEVLLDTKDTKETENIDTNTKEDITGGSTEDAGKELIG